ncbi:MAG: CDP-diacylglycerol--glycerol-3-phosphate 3-phosphatidyltransferase [Actinomycetota bacterium]
MSDTGYHPEKILTPANAITLARLVLAVPWVILVARDGATWLTFGLGFVLSATDFLDGWLARRQGTTNSGAFLDPLADKVLVLGGMFALVVRDRFSPIPVAIIAARELIISGWRSYAGRRGVSVPARRLAKWKTFIQQLAIGLALLPVVASRTDVPADAMLWFAVALTLWTGFDYLRDAGRMLRTVS